MNLNQNQTIMYNVSKNMYRLLRSPSSTEYWHDNPEDYFFGKYKTGYEKYSQEFFQTLKDNDVDLRAYCIFACTLALSANFRTPMSLYGRLNIRSMIIDLREYCESSELFIEAANVIRTLLIHRRTTEYKKTAYFATKNLVKPKEGLIGDSEEDNNTYLQTYFMLVDRIQEFRAKGYDPHLWVVKKFNKCTQILSEDFVFSVIANRNRLDLHEFK